MIRPSTGTLSKYYTYIIQSVKDDSFYVGSCEDLDKRLSKHNDGLSKYTSSKTPWRLRYFEVFGTRSEALVREKAIKGMKSRVYLKRLIAEWMRN